MIYSKNMYIGGQLDEGRSRVEVIANEKTQANDCGDGGLTTYVFTGDLARTERYAAALRYGEVQINGVKYDIDLPHGGMGQSVIGHDCSHLALHDYLTIKRISRAIAA